MALDPKKLLSPEGPIAFLPRRWAVETSEALVYVAVRRLMVRRLARA